MTTQTQYKVTTTLLCGVEPAKERGGRYVDWYEAESLEAAKLLCAEDEHRYGLTAADRSQVWELADMNGKVIKTL